MPFRRLLLAATLLTAARAGAQPVEGLYLGAGAGLDFVPDLNDQGVRLRTRDPGFAGVLSLGWGFGNGWRAEIEGNYRTDEVDRLSLNGARVGSSGYYDKYGAMANLMFDFDLSSFGIAPSTYQPYLGFGGGYVWNEIRKARFAVAGSGYRIEDTDPQFAYQAILGSAFGLGNLAPGLSVTAEYRFLGTLDPKFTINRTSGPAGPRRARQLRADELQPLRPARPALCLQPAAGRRRPVPAPVAAPEVARTYLVFFDWDRADLTDRARQIIAEAAGAARRVQTRGSRSPAMPTVRHAAIQPAPVAAPRRGGGDRAGEAGRRPGGDRGHRLRRDQAAGADRGRGARAAEPPGRDRPALSGRARARRAGPRPDEGGRRDGDPLPGRRLGAARPLLLLCGAGDDCRTAHDPALGRPEGGNAGVFGAFMLLAPGLAMVIASAVMIAMAEVLADRIAPWPPAWRGSRRGCRRAPGTDRRYPSKRPATASSLPAAAGSRSAGAVMMAWSSARSQPAGHGLARLAEHRDHALRPASWPCRRCRTAPSPFVHRDVVVVGMPAVEVGHHGDGHVADLGLAGELGLRHVGHADDVQPQAPVQPLSA